VPGAVGALVGDATELLAERASPVRSPVRTLSVGVFGEPDPKGRIDRFVTSMGRSSGPRLDFLHVLLPHGPWRFLPTGETYRAPWYPEGVGAFTRWTGGSELAAAGRQRHLLQLQFADAQLGRVLDRARRLGTYDKSLIVVAADHGVSFIGSLRTPSRTSYPQVLWAPFFVKRPGAHAGTVSDASVRSTDILPTIADVVGLPIPWSVDGRSALRSARRTERLRFFQTDVLRTTGHDVYFDGRGGYEAVLRTRGPGAPGDPLRLYRLGPLGALVGTSLDGLTVRRDSSVQAQLDDRDAFDDVDLSAGTLPVYVSGRAATEKPIVVTVNGMIGGSSQTFQKGDEKQRSFFTMIPSTLLRQGRNEVRLFIAEGDLRAPTLVPVGTGENGGPGS
jgi:sulfatase-like protein